MTRNMRQELDDLIEIVDALCDTLVEDADIYQYKRIMKSIADRASEL